MAGLGRRTHYRKHLTDAVLNDLPEPQDDEKIARVVATRGGNQFDVCVANDHMVHLAILPTKFHKLVWVKRGDYVIVQVGDEGDENGNGSIGEGKSKGNNHDDGGIRHMISHILYKDQVKHLKSKKLWPEDDPEFSRGTGAQNGYEDENLEDNDGIVYQDYDGEVEDDLFVNTNRIARLEIQESSEDDSSDEEN